jgi:hypothetical protein
VTDAQSEVEGSGEVLWGRSWGPAEEERAFTEGGAYTIAWGKDVQTPITQGQEIQITSETEEVNMSDTEKGAGRGRGKWTAKGVQAGVNADVEAMKVLIADMAARLDALEGGGAPEEEVPLDPDVPYVDNTLPGDLPAEG